MLNHVVQVLDTPEPLRNLAQLIAAQMEFHKHAYEILSELMPVVEGLQEEQEARLYNPKISAELTPIPYRLLIVRTAARLSTMLRVAQPRAVVFTAGTFRICP